MFFRGVSRYQRARPPPFFSRTERNFVTNGHDRQSARSRRSGFFELLRRLKLCASVRPALNITRLLNQIRLQKNLDL